MEFLWKRVLNVKSSLRDSGLGIETWAEKESSVCVSIYLKGMCGDIEETSSSKAK